MATPGTLDRTPPPFFRQGLSARSRMLLCVALAVFLMVADARLQLTQPLRSVLATVLLPVQHVLLMPFRALETAQDWGTGLDTALAENRDLRMKLTLQAQSLAQVEQLSAENAQLRELVELQKAAPPSARVAEVLFEASDPHTRKLFISSGSQQGIRLASPVINHAGLIGQVTRVYPLNAEVTLLDDRDASVPVINRRTRQRGVAFGGSGERTGIELRYTATNADVQVGDELVTSGLDGVFPAGLAVARVAFVQRQAESSFARIALEPMAVPDGVRHVLVLQPAGRREVAR